MAAPSATAAGVNAYFHETDRVASWHFSLDDHEVYQEIPIDEVGWHAGTSDVTDLTTGRYNNSVPIESGNEYGVSIESCVYKGVDFDMVMRNLAKLTAELLIKYNLKFSDIKQHYNFSGKDCPQVIRRANRWGELMDLIMIEYFAIKNLSDVSFEWISLSPTILDDKGRIINHNGNKQTVNYKVIVSYKNETREYEYSSVLQEINMEAI
jgi:N-acetylmuramoyl-L-alanine amidase CwlA